MSTTILIWRELPLSSKFFLLFDLSFCHLFFIPVSYLFPTSLFSLSLLFYLLHHFIEKWEVPLVLIGHQLSSDNVSQNFLSFYLTLLFLSLSLTLLSIYSFILSLTYCAFLLLFSFYSFSTFCFSCYTLFYAPPIIILPNVAEALKFSHLIVDIY